LNGTWCVWRICHDSDDSVVAMTASLSLYVNTHWKMYCPVDCYWRMCIAYLIDTCRRRCREDIDTWRHLVQAVSKFRHLDIRCHRTFENHTRLKRIKKSNKNTDDGFCDTSMWNRLWHFLCDTVYMISSVTPPIWHLLCDAAYMTPSMWHRLHDTFCDAAYMTLPIWHLLWYYLYVQYLCEHGTW
jgi:hypothetical protein